MKCDTWSWIIKATSLSINGRYVSHDHIWMWWNFYSSQYQTLLRRENLKLEFMLLILHLRLGMLELNLDLQCHILLDFHSFKKKRCSTYKLYSQRGEWNQTRHARVVNFHNESSFHLWFTHWFRGGVYIYRKNSTLMHLLISKFWLDDLDSRYMLMGRYGSLALIYLECHHYLRKKCLYVHICIVLHLFIYY